MKNQIKVTKKDILWSYAAQFLSVASGLIVLPLVLKLLSAEEIGFNYVMLSVGAIATLVDFGFSVQIQRNVTYVSSGVKELYKEGYDSVESTTEIKIDYRLFKKVLVTAKYIYGILALAVLFLLATFGTCYIHRVTHGFTNIENSAIIWPLFIISTCFQLYFLYFNPMLVGSGKIEQYRKSVVITQVVKITLSFIFLVIGFGLLGLVLANLLSVLVGRVVSRIYLYTPVLIEALQPFKISWSEIKHTFVIIWHNAKKAGIHSLTTVVIYNCPVLLVGAYYSLETVGSYGLMTQLVTVLLSTSIILYTTYLPKLTQLCVCQEQKEVQSIASQSIFLAWIIFIFGLIAMIFIGNPLLTWYGSNTILPSLWIVLLYGLGRLIDGTYWSLVQLLSIKNTYPYIKTFVYTALIIVLCSYFVVTLTNWGLMGVVLATMIPRLLFNDFLWIKRSLDSVQLSLGQIFRLSVARIYVFKK